MQAKPLLVDDYMSRVGLYYQYNGEMCSSPVTKGRQRIVNVAEVRNMSLKDGENQRQIGSKKVSRLMTLMY